jgi:hypothetical protein
MSSLIARDADRITALGLRALDSTRVARRSRGFTMSLQHHASSPIDFFELAHSTSTLMLSPSHPVQ